MLQRQKELQRQQGAEERYTRRAQEAERHAEVLRRVLLEDSEKSEVG